MRRRGSRFVLAALLCAGVAWSRASPPITVDRLVVRPIEEDALPPPTRPDEVPDDDDERDAVRVIARETERGHWDGDAVARVRAVLRGRTPSRAAAIFRMAGFARPIAIRLAISFSSADDEMFAMRIGRKTLLTLSFLRIGVGDWEPTPETRANLSLPFHPRLPAPLAPPPGEGPAKGTYARSDAIGPHRFPSGVLATALRFTLVIRGHTMNVTTSEDLLRDDGSLADRIVELVC